MTEELKPCPFHKEEQPAEIKNLSIAWWVKCSYCNTDGPKCRSREEAIEAWNRRQPHE